MQFVKNGMVFKQDRVMTPERLFDARARSGCRREMDEGAAAAPSDALYLLGVGPSSRDYHGSGKLG